MTQLNRCTGAAAFSEADPAFLRAAAPLAGAALRRALLEEPAHTDPGRGPGVVILDESGIVISATAEADAWLEELADGWRKYPTNINIHPELLMLSLSTLTEADALTRRVRQRTLNGTWLGLTHRRWPARGRWRWCSSRARPRRSPRS